MDADRHAVQLPGKEISRGRDWCMDHSRCRLLRPATLAAARLVALAGAEGRQSTLMDFGYSVLPYGAPLLIMDHIALMFFARVTTHH